MSSAPLLLVRRVCARIKPRRLLRYPRDERRDIRMPAQRFPRVIGLQQFALGERRVDLAMADLVDRVLVAPLERLRDQVMAVNVLRSQWPSAQRAGVIGRGSGLVMWHARHMQGDFLPHKS